MAIVMLEKRIDSRDLCSSKWTCYVVGQDSAEKKECDFL